MNGFDILAEAKIRQWETDVREGRAKRPSPDATITTASFESLEKVLYRDIRELIVKSCMEEGGKRQDMREDAAKMQVQLVSRLEKSGYNRMSRMFSEEIETLRNRADALEGDEQALLALLREGE